MSAFSLRLLEVLALAVVSISLGSDGRAQEVRPDPELRARFGFVGPDIEKIGDGVRLLRVADVDDDGRDEIVVFDSERARFTILDRTDGVGEEGAPGYDRQHIDSHGSVWGFVLVDLDADSKLDLAYYDRRGRIIAIPALDDEASRRSIEVGPPASRGNVVRAGDLDGDGKAEIVVATASGFRVIRGLLDDEPDVSAAVALGERNFGPFDLLDVDGDGNLDLMLGLSTDSTPLWVRLGDGKGGFGSWLLFDVPRFRFAFAGPGRSGEAGASLAMVDTRQWRLAEYALRPSTEADAPAMQLDTLEPIKSGAFPFAHIDADGDGVLDLVIAHPDRAELAFFLERGGRFERETVATLDHVDSVAVGDVDADGRQDLVLCSGREGVVGWRSGAWPLDRFPGALPLPADREPLAVAVTGAGGVIVVAQTKRREGEVYAVAAGAEPTLLAKLGRLGGKPQRVWAADFDRDGHEDLAFVTRTEGLWILPGTEGGYGDRVGEAGFTDKIGDGAVAALGGDEQNLLVVRDRFARIVQLQEGGALAIQQQLNAPPGTEFALGAQLADGEEFAFLDTESNKLLRLAEGRPVRSIDVPGITATHLLVHGDDVLVLGRDALLRVSSGSGFVAEKIRGVGRLGEDSVPFRGIATDLDGDGTREAVLIDEDFNGLHVLVARDDEFVPAMAFPVFEVGQKYDKVWEPSEIRAGDLDGDGRRDLVLISHDRLLMYRQG